MNIKIIFLKTLQHLRWKKLNIDVKVIFVRGLDFNFECRSEV